MHLDQLVNVGPVALRTLPLVVRTGRGGLRIAAKPVDGDHALFYVEYLQITRASA